MTVARGLVAVDGFALFFKLLFLVSAALTVLMSPRYLSLRGRRPGEYYFLVLCATLGMMFMAGGIDLITLFIGLETMAVSFYVLDGYLRPNRRSNEAAIKYFLLGAFSLGDPACTACRCSTGSPAARICATIATALAAGDGGLMLLFAVMLLVAGLGFKIAAVPFHMWAPDVYEGAPTPITAFLSVGSKTASFAMLLRIFVEGLPPSGWTASAAVRAAARMERVLLRDRGGDDDRRQRRGADAGQHQAHARVFVDRARGVHPHRHRRRARRAASTAALVYLMVYAFMQLGAFAVVVMMRRADVIGDELKDLTGLYATHPAAAVAMLLFMLSLGGIPPTAGFMGKLWVFGAAIEAGLHRAGGDRRAQQRRCRSITTSASSCSCGCRRRTRRRRRSACRPALAAVLIVTVAGTIVLGVYPRLLFELAEASASRSVRRGRSGYDRARIREPPKLNQQRLRLRRASAASRAARARAFSRRGAHMRDAAGGAPGAIRNVGPREQ